MGTNNLNENNIDNNNNLSASKKILVVDDILYVVKSISKILTEAGYYVLTATTGKEAIDVIKKNPVDLITIDQKLPDMNGVKLVDEIRKLNFEIFPKIIFISAIYDKEEIQSILTHSVDNFILKPFKKNKLLEIINELFNKK